MEYNVWLKHKVSKNNGRNVWRFRQEVVTLRKKSMKYMEELLKKDSETYHVYEKQHSKTWLAMQKYKGTVTVYDKSLFY